MNRKLITEARAVLAEHRAVCSVCTRLDLCPEAQPLEEAVQELAAAYLKAHVAQRRKERRCACGGPAVVTLRYYRHKDGRRTVSDAKCLRCADRDAFALMKFSTDRVTAKLVES